MLYCAPADVVFAEGRVCANKLPDVALAFGGVVAARS